MFFSSMQPPPFASSILSRQLSVHNSSSQRILLSLSKERRRLITNPFTSSSSCCIVYAVKKQEEDSKQYEIDTEKAREALKELDQKIIQSAVSNNNKQVSSPKLTAVLDEDLSRDQVSDNGKLEISESFLATLAAGLVLFTIFYNVLFYSVIKPSIDGVS